MPTVTVDTALLQRRAMVDSQLRTNDVTEPRLVAAIADTPREPHLPAAHRAAPYIDRAIPVANGRAINPPLTTARLIDEAQVSPGSKVLLIGAATGYAAAVLVRLGAEVTAVEEDAGLLAEAREILGGASGLTFVEGPLHQGAPSRAPFDCLIVDGAVESLPKALLTQLRDGARISCGLVDKGVTRLARAGVGPGAATVRPLPFAELECVHLPGFAPPPRFSF